MVTCDYLRSLIEEKIECSALHVQGDDGVHFEAIIVSPEFEGKSLRARHELVYKLLSEEIREIHAFSMKTLTPSEYSARKS